MRGMVATTLAMATLWTTPAAPEVDFCAGVKDPAWREACRNGHFDPRSGIPVGSPSDRHSYAEKLRRIFLSQGIDMSVVALEQRPKNRRSKSPLDKYPQLHVFGFLSNPLVFQLITEGRVLSVSKELGFRSVEFYSNAGQGGWWYDLSASTLPACDIAKRVCR